jgi:hypothetical protein
MLSKTYYATGTAIHDAVKLALRIQALALDDDITDNIAAAINDLEISGVVVTPTDSVFDPLIQQAIKIYCKAYIGGADNAERNLKCYDMLKTALMLSGEYAEVESDG